MPDVYSPDGIYRDDPRDDQVRLGETVYTVVPQRPDGPYYCEENIQGHWANGDFELVSYDEEGQRGSRLVCAACFERLAAQEGGA